MMLFYPFYCLKSSQSPIKVTNSFTLANLVFLKLTWCIHFIIYLAIFNLDGFFIVISLSCFTNLKAVFLKYPSSLKNFIHNFYPYLIFHHLMIQPTIRNSKSNLIIFHFSFLINIFIP